jgi:hypothetical protein
LEAEVKDLLRHSIAIADYVNLNICDRGAVHSANLLEGTENWGSSIRVVTYPASMGIDLCESNTGLDFVSGVERWTIDVDPCIGFDFII